MSPADFKAARLRLGMTQAQFARALKLGRTGERSVRRYEDGERRVPGPVEVAVGMMLAESDRPDDDARQVRREVIEAAHRPGPMCRDCADARVRQGVPHGPRPGPVCPHSGLPCDPYEAALETLRRGSDDAAAEERARCLRIAFQFAGERGRAAVVAGTIARKIRSGEQP